MSFNFQFSVENLGNIEKAEITVKPLTVIAGENSSGKTFITKTLYAILNSVGSPLFIDTLKKRLDKFEYKFSDFYNAFINPAQKDIDFYTTLHENIEEYQELIKELESFPLSELEKNIEEYKSKFIPHMFFASKYIENCKKYKKYKNIMQILEELIEAQRIFIDTFKNFDNVLADGIADKLSEGFKKNFQITDIGALIKSDQKMATLAIDTVGEVKLQSKADLEFEFTKTGIEVVQNLRNIVFFDSPVYTKIRRALDNARKSISIRIMPSKYLTGYPEYIEELYAYIDQKYIDTPDFNEISEDIQSLISGKLDVQAGGEIVYEDKNGHRIPLSLTAMGIGNIGIIEILLRNNTINKGSFLIMDEPEAHLHPLWQVELAKFLYKLAKNGANIIIATHSIDLLKAFQVMFEDNEKEAEQYIAINKMSYSKEFAQRSEYEKINTILDDLSAPYYDLYTRAL